MSDPQSPRKPRLSEQETRSRLLELASQTLVQHGLGVGLDAIRMEKLIAQAGVSRASAYRCWPHRDDFVADALVQTIRQTSLLPEEPEDIERLVELVTEASDHLQDPQGRRDLVVEALRTSIDADVRRIVASPRWRLFMALSATVHTIDDERLRELVRHELTAMEEVFVQRRADVYGGVCQMIGYRQQAPWAGREGLLVLSQQSGLAMRGVASRALAQPSWLEQRTTVALFGSSHAADWSQPEIALTGILLHHLEPDPEILWDEQQVASSRRLFDEIAASLGR